MGLLDKTKDLGKKTVELGKKGVDKGIDLGKKGVGATKEAVRKHTCVECKHYVTADENSGDMVGVMSEFRQLAEQTEAAVVLIHHQRKSTGFTGRAGDSLRGHSSIEAALDLALLVEREELSDTINIKATKVRGEDVHPFSAVFTCDHRDDGELGTAKFFGIAAEDNRSVAAIEREVLVALLGASMNKTDLTKAVKEMLPEVGINRIRDMIDRLASAGKLYISNGKNNTEKIYSRS